MEMKVEVISRETIRPSSPTPDHLKTFNLSIFDQFAPAAYTPVVLFYTKTGLGFDATISHRLKSSLSDTLSCLYPFAGRIMDNIGIDCNDDGVEFLEARISGDTSLMDFLGRPDLDVLSQFLPVEIMSSEAYTGSLVQVQANFFESGGLAIGISMSHKLADSATLITFIKWWVHFARDGPTEIAPPDFTAASAFPPSKMFTSVMHQPMEAPKENPRTRRFVFDSGKIAALRAESASKVVPCPTKVETVSALLWKCKISAMKSVTEPPKSSVLSQVVNLRKRIAPPLPEDSVGNLIGLFTATADKTVEEEDLPSMVAKMRKSMEEYVRDYASKLCGPDGLSRICKDNKEIGELMGKDSVDLFMFSSWCRLGLYESDFGWGKPDWTSSCSLVIKNISILMDTEDGKGVEAWVTLPEREMELFEHDRCLLSFAASDSY